MGAVELTCWAGGCVLAVALTGCSAASTTRASTSSAPPLVLPTAVEVTALDAAAGPAAACDSAIIIDHGGSGGERTPEGALQVWLDGAGRSDDPASASPSTPRTGWVTAPAEEDGVQQFSAGDWSVKARSGSFGLWIVTEQACEGAALRGELPG